MFNQCVWRNEPGAWRIESGVLHVKTDPATDFWQKTHYGFMRDSGHFFGVEVAGDFTAQIYVQGDYEALYDQAGLMVRVDGTNWVKAGVEVSDGELLLGSVLTIDQSDWATGPLQQGTTGIWLRISVIDGVLRIQSSVDGLRWPLMRLSPFPKRERYWVGPMCCSPERGGLQVGFTEFTVVSPLNKMLHDLS
jgi:regulation of enolase protein 1 (concanavalin A-like superfamily)